MSRQSLQSMIAIARSAINASLQDMASQTDPLSQYVTDTDLATSSIPSLTAALNSSSPSVKNAFAVSAATGINGTIGANEIIVSFSDIGVFQCPHCVNVTPDENCLIGIYSSDDNGATYTFMSSVRTRTIFQYDRAPNENWITHIKFVRMAGTSSNSTFSIRR